MICDLDSLRQLASHPLWALSPQRRLRGMIARRFSPEMDAMIFPRCRAVHSCLMTRRLDLLFLDPGGRVVRLVENFPPWRMADGGPAAVTTIELPPGTLRRGGVEVGHRINFNANLTPDAVEKIAGATILS